MPVPDRTPENCDKLAERIVEDMDLDALVEYAKYHIADFYKSHDLSFEEDWLITFGEEVG